MVSLGFLLSCADLLFLIFLNRTVSGPVAFYLSLQWSKALSCLLFVSDVQAIFKPPNAMRGGIQMCFPQVLQHDPFLSRFRFYWVLLFCCNFGFICGVQI